MNDSDKTKKDWESYKEIVLKYSRLFLCCNTIEYFCLENIEKDRSGIIASNHVGSSKDIMSLVDVFMEEDEQIFFAARKEMFKAEGWYGLIKQHLKNHLKLFSYIIPEKLIRKVADSTHSDIKKMEEIGTIIPFDIQNRKDFRASMMTVNQYLSEYGRKVVIFQFDKKEREADRRFIFHGANKGAAYLANKVYKEHKIEVPIYPTAILGSGSLLPLDCMITTLSKKPIRVSFGKPLEITSFLDEEKPVDAMTHALDVNIRKQIRELAKNKEKGTVIYPARLRL